MQSGLEPAITAFNRQDYYLAHEILEDFWNGIDDGEPHKQYIQALIQLTVVLHLIQEGRFTGATKVYLRAEKNLSNCNGPIHGIDILNLQNQVQKILAKCINDNTRDFACPIIQIS